MWLIAAACQDKPMTYSEQPFPANQGASDANPVGSNPTEVFRTELSPRQRAQARMHVDLDNAMTQTAWAMTHDYATQTWQTTQPARQLYSDEFHQGFTGALATENFKQTRNKNLDILVVIDNSASMQEEQANLATKLLPLLGAVQDYDWRIGVTTTDPSDKCLRRVIHKNDANTVDAFYQAVRAGIKGSGNERGVYTAVRALQGNCDGFGAWVRSDSALAVLVVSDEDNCSDQGVDCGNEPYARADYLTDYLARTRVVGQNAKIFGLIWHPSQERNDCVVAEHQGFIYADLVATSKGTWGSICDSDYTATLTAVSTNLLAVLQRQFTLAKAPDPGQTIRVEVDGQVMQQGYHVSGNVLTFDHAPAENSAIRVVYRHSGAPILNSFTLTQAAAENTLAVAVNGVLQGPQQYDWDRAQRRITFHTTPPESAVIRVEYRDNAPLATRFQLPQSYKSGSVELWINQMLTPVKEVSPQQGVIVIDPAPQDLAQISVRYLHPGAPLLSYALDVDDTLQAQVAIVDQQTGKNVPFQWTQSHQVSFAASEFKEGRILVATYPNAHRDDFSIQLPHDPIPQSVWVSGDAVYCKDAVILEGRKVRGDQCGFDSDIAAVDLGYEYFVGDVLPLFDVQPPDAALSPWAQWRVWVDKKEITAFTHHEQMLKIDEDLSDASSITVQITY